MDGGRACPILFDLSLTVLDTSSTFVFCPLSGGVRGDLVPRPTTNVPLSLSFSSPSLSCCHCSRQALKRLKRFHLFSGSSLEALYPTLPLFLYRYLLLYLWNPPSPRLFSSALVLCVFTTSRLFVRYIRLIWALFSADCFLLIVFCYTRWSLACRPHRFPFTTGVVVLLGGRWVYRRHSYIYVLLCISITHRRRSFGFVRNRWSV